MPKPSSKSALDVLCRVKWQAFVSLSFPDVRPGVMVGPYIRERMLFAWLRRVGRAGGKGKDDALSYPWAVRAELGERTARFHYHPLIGGLSPTFVSRFVLRARPSVGYWWEALGGGTCRTSAVFDNLGVVEYFDKASKGGFEYEVHKFGANHTILSKYLIARLGSSATPRVLPRTPLSQTKLASVEVERVTRPGPAEALASENLVGAGRN